MTGAPRPRPKRFFPTSDRVLVLPDSPPDRSAGGIIYPTFQMYRKTRHDQTYDFTVPLDPHGFQDRAVLTGIVVRVGQGFWTRKGRFRPTTLVRGLRVLFPSRRGSWLLLRGVRHVLLREDEIDGVFLPDDDDLAFDGSGFVGVARETSST